MAWTRIDDKFLNNIKVQKAGALGMALYLAGLIHCNTNLTDGFIDEEILPMLYGLSYQSARNKSVDKLVELKLWHKVNGGYEINDFLDFNKSKNEIDKLNIQRAKNGAKNNPNAKQNRTETGTGLGTETGTGLGTETGSKSVPINPNTLIPLVPNTQKDTTTTGAAAVFSAYESEIGMLTGMVRELIVDALSDYPDFWIVEAIQEAASQNKRNWKYCDAILKRWQVDGFKVDTRKSQVKRNNNGGHKSLSPELDEILKDAPIFAEDK